MIFRILDWVYRVFNLCSFQIFFKSTPTKISNLMNVELDLFSFDFVPVPGGTFIMGESQYRISSC